MTIPIMNCTFSRAYGHVSRNQIRFRYVLIWFCNQKRLILDFFSKRQVNTLLLRTVTNFGYGYKRDPIRIRNNHNMYIDWLTTNPGSVVQSDPPCLLLRIRK